MYAGGGSNDDAPPAPCPAAPGAVGAVGERGGCGSGAAGLGGFGVMALDLKKLRSWSGISAIVSAASRAPMPSACVEPTEGWSKEVIVRERDERAGGHAGIQADARRYTGTTSRGNAG